MLKKKEWIVSKYDTKEKSTRAYAPFTTSTLYQSASSILGWSSSKAASVAQQLYTDGLITYIRSDSTFIVPEFVDDMRTLLGQNMDKIMLLLKLIFLPIKRGLKKHMKQSGLQM